MRATHWAVASGKSDTLLALLKAGAVYDAVNAQGETCLMNAYVTDASPPTCVAMAQALLDAVADPLIEDRQGQLALHHAADQGNPNMIDLLLQAKGSSLSKKMLSHSSMWDIHRFRAPWRTTKYKPWPTCCCWARAPQLIVKDAEICFGGRL
ncbi:conserved unknown protein [Ectocarpus siliculosus]|uniref:Uncharacterized protein n=1 Tax=Ectocarpus siliculosus TaxID=2880 RepID=D8LSK5_ECTSI|nr:conserved unknown protein [Ectocarpus siliculosus]|eukprot:CBN77842.1 conserved unknown protein [Ectocarpus siliculosus]